MPIVMPPSHRIRVVGLFAAVLLVAVIEPALSQAAAPRACKPVINPYEGTRYEGVDLRRIRATAVSCRTARRVARRAHRKALGLAPPASGIREFTWRRWSVTGDIRGASDRYLAKAPGGKRVRWRF
jgi:hypothetical protein